MVFLGIQESVRKIFQLDCLYEFMSYVDFRTVSCDAQIPFVSLSSTDN